MTTVRYLLDTNICIYIRRQRPPEIKARFERLAPQEAAISAITFGELRYGAEKSASRDAAMTQLEELALVLPVLDLPVSASSTYGVLRSDLERRGEIIGNNDLWIASHALAADLVLVSNNTREYARIGQLKLENWVEQGQR